MRLKTSKSVQPWWWTGGVSVLVLATTSFMVASRTLSGAELSLFRSINNWPETLRPLFFAVTQLGSSWALYAVTLFVIWKRRYRLSMRLFLSGGLSWLACEMLKQLIGRPRPEGLLMQLHVRDSIVVGNGFPSGHTAVATALALVLWPLAPPGWRWLVIPAVVLVGVSRVYLGVHAPLDSIGGMAVGVTVVSASRVLTGKLRFVTKITGLTLR